jgi:hypothetical protein
MTASKIHYISFCSEGTPYDSALDLTNSKNILTNELAKTDMEYFFYSPRYLKENGYGEYVKEHPNPGLVFRNPGMNLVGFCAWKPLIMLLELEKMNDGDILVYRDCNCEKYEQLKDFTNFREHVDKILRIANFDFFIPAENTTLKAGNHVKTNVITDLAIDVDFTRNFPLLIANVLICRKSSVSHEILQDWKNHCLIDKYINGEQYGELFPEFRWYTPEQGILTVLISNYVYEGRFQIPKNYPNVILGNREIDKIITVDNSMIESFDTYFVFDPFDYLVYFITFVFILLLFFVCMIHVLFPRNKKS